VVLSARAGWQIGHLLGRYQSHGRIARERGAWRWAKKNALAWTARMENDARSRFWSYAKAAGLQRSEWKRPPDRTEIRIIDDAIELDGVTVARLLPNLRLSLRDRLVEAFDSLDEDYIALLENRIAELEAKLNETAR
jgi:hypothetical protein